MKDRTAAALTEDARTAVKTTRGRPPKHQQVSQHNQKLATNRIFFLYASLAGTFGALSAVVGKLAVAESSGESIAALATPLLSAVGVHIAGAQLSGVLLLAVRGLLLAVNAFCTAQMWRWYLKALSCGPTAVCQIINTGTNFAVSALFGLLVFREEITVSWAAGALLVVVGLALVVTDADAPVR
ncbi:hypothetical protein DQ04_00521190 [Trypanosoma grayi]|uniref:hypothetical protein n=1 Tax=Trypanosoma grayi TaxID=71804 RepID=UPI0004F4667A|nr:hypothetical protein DQ04_00521190 [Trypanosoma grayi]KEG14334.1 hypothetical protein DQ04_00521190 [Trypanosoma grayi]